MSESETSSDIKVKYETSNGENLLEDNNMTKKVQSSETDYYFNIIANPNKVMQRKEVDLESSDINNIVNEPNSEASNSSKSSLKNFLNENINNKSETSNSSKSSKSREKYEKISINKNNSQMFNNSSQESETKPKNQVPINMQSQMQQQMQPQFQPQMQQQQPPQVNQQSQQQSPNMQNSQINQNQQILQPPSILQQTIPTAPLIQPFSINQQTETKELSASEIRMKKIEMLRKLSEIKSKGYQLSKEYNFNSSLDEMEYEYDLLKSFADKRNGVKVFKSGLLQVVSLVEFLNDKYDPFDFHLAGWGDHMQVETESWDDVLEEIYEKYKGTGKKVAPEVRLLLLIIASASAFHFTKSQSSNLPGLDSLLASNPGLLSKIINPGKGESSQFMSPQEINIERQRAEIKKNQTNVKLPTIQKPVTIQPTRILPPQIPQASEILSQQINQPTRANNQATYSAFGNTSPSIKAPDKVKDILNRIHNLQPVSIKQLNTETQDETSSNNDRIISETTLSDTSPSKKKNNRKPKKTGISII